MSSSGRRWRVAAVAAAVAAGALFVTSSLSSRGLDLRGDSVSDLDTVLRQEKARTDSLQGDVGDLDAQVSRLTRQVDDTGVERLQRQVDALRGPAGLSAVSGTGLRVTLDDAPASEVKKAEEDGLTDDAVVVHQQDIQAVVNALWAGGAEAMAVQGQRVVSTTGIKCVGNTVILQGVPYSPPYVIEAVGDPAQLQASLDRSDYVDAYKTFVARYRLGYEVRAGVLKVPAYAGTTDLRYARAAPATPAGRK